MNRLPIKSLGKRLLSPLYRHTSGTRPDIFIFSTQRSGSTLLFDMTASQRGMKAVGEPLQERKQPVTAQYLPHLYSRYVQLDTAMENGLRRYMQDLLAGRFTGGFERSYDLFNPRHHFRTSRNVVKILRANHLLPWFIETFPGRYVFLVRHPIPTALSRARNGWNAPIDSFIRQNQWFEKLSKEQRQFVTDVESGRVAAAIIRRHILVWCLEHVGMEALLGSGPGGHSGPSDHSGTAPLFLPYETLITAPENVINTLVNTLEIEDAVAFAEALQRPSRSSRYSEQDTHEAIHEGHRQSLVEAWSQRVDTSLVAFVGDALSVFGIPWYRADNPYPVSYPVSMPPGGGTVNQDTQ